MAVWAQRLSSDAHVDELAQYLNGVRIAAPIMYRQMAVYPVLVDDASPLRGGWLTLDAAISRGALVVREKNGGSVPVVSVENRSRDEYVFIMMGEVIAGGMQTRTIRNDVVLAPGQRVDLDVFCVEAHRWAGKENFAVASKVMAPQSIQAELRKGADQRQVWAEVHRNNTALAAENATGSLEVAMSKPAIRAKLDDVRKNVAPEVPRGTTGFIFVDHGRALGAEFFGREDLARGLLPKLLDSYAVDYLLLGNRDDDRQPKSNNRVAIDFFEQVCRAGSERTATVGSGAGMRTREGGLLGDGVGLGRALVHYGVQIGKSVAPQPMPKPVIIYPNQSGATRQR